MFSIFLLRSDSPTLFANSMFSSAWAKFKIGIYDCIFMSAWAMRFLLIKVPIFFNHISEIFSLISKKQMIRVYASSIVAFMADKQFFLYWPNPKLVGNTMGRIVFFTNSEPSISTTGTRFFPFHTSGRSYINYE